MRRVVLDKLEKKGKQNVGNFDTSPKTTPHTSPKTPKTTDECVSSFDCEECEEANAKIMNEKLPACAVCRANKNGSLS
jgi:hypothetical protein